MKFALLFALVSTVGFAGVTIKGKGGKLYQTGLVHEEVSQAEILSREFADVDGCEALPESYDLRPLGVVPEVRDQGNCGSCWAFSKTASLMSALLNVNQTVDLSEQELVSCDQNNDGCGGGNLNSPEYQVKHGQGLFPKTCPTRLDAADRMVVVRRFPPHLKQCLLCMLAHLQGAQRKRN